MPNVYAKSFLQIVCHYLLKVKVIKDFKNYECFDWYFSNVWVLMDGILKLPLFLLRGLKKKSYLPQNQIFSGKFIKKIFPMPPTPGCTGAAWDPIRIFHKIRSVEVFRPGLKMSLLKVILTCLLLSYAIIYQNFAKCQ